MERLSHACSPVDDYINKDILDEILKDNDCEIPRDDDEVVDGKVKHELRVTNSNPRVTSSN